MDFAIKKTGGRIPLPVSPVPVSLPICSSRYFTRITSSSQSSESYEFRRIPWPLSTLMHLIIRHPHLPTICDF
ncbi:hypothetical protein J2Z66_002419 [Paenibacillus eucommiae]|uniref:Uncharacterized protein n=1 Tax=Paenibacillus eucommiae TaxID=1355755 RepID=A0ABS4ITD3_9BACL|nr:hypothetical protein [Paenibacillus eucommiae]